MSISRIRALAALGAVAVLGALTLAPAMAQASSSAPSQQQYLTLAKQGISKASAWANSKYHWYNELLKDRNPSPQATIWAIVPLFESVDYVTMASPSAANVALLKHFASKAEGYWDKNVTPAPGVHTKTPAYAPYPGSWNDPETFFDDNSWWSLAFMDAHSAMLKAKLPALAARYLRDAERGFAFINRYGWDTANAGGSGSVMSTHGGLWWNTWHVIKGGTGRSGEALGAATELGAELYQATGNKVYLASAEKYITWANQNLLKWDGSYAVAIPHEVQMPHDGEGAMIGAFTALCEATNGASGSVPASVYSFLPPNKTRGVNPSFRRPVDPTSWCSWAENLAHDTAFGVNPGGGLMDGYFPLNDGPQWDAIYVRGLLSLYAYDHDASWYRLATETATRIENKAKDSSGLFTKTWSGSTRVPDAAPGELRTDGASVSVLAALAATPAG